MTAPLLVFGWGNPSRGDDALGPLFIERLRATLAEAQQAGRVELLDDFQLQVEHTLDLVGRERVLFVDASLDATPPFEAHAIAAEPDAGCSTHALSPQALLQVYRDLHGADAPPCTLLAIRGEGFGLGQPLSAPATANLDAALRWFSSWFDAA